MTPSRRGRRNGFTLVESMATVAVLSILGSIASFLILDAVDGYMDATTSTQLHVEASVAMERIMRELRKIELDGGASGIAPNITDTDPTWMAWTDVDSDAYQLLWTGSVVKLTVDGGSAAELLTDVTDLTIKTFDEDNTQLGDTLTGAQCDPIRRIEVSVTLDRDGVTERLRARTFIRSTMPME